MIEYYTILYRKNQVNFYSTSAPTKINLIIDKTNLSCYNITKRGRLMDITYQYVNDLENLIVTKLLPVYEEYYKAKGIKNPIADIQSKALREILHKKQLPALLRPKEK